MAAILLGAGAALVLTSACGGPRSGSVAEPAPPPLVNNRVEQSIAEFSPETAERAARLANLIIRMSPTVDPASAQLRDQAAVRLSRMGDLIDLADLRILWGHYDSAKGYDPADYHMLALPPEVWARLYLSCFMFSGTPREFRTGDFLVVELPATFRGGLEPGEYPHPLWHSLESWKAYSDTQSLLLVFTSERLVGAFSKAPAASDAPDAAPPAWDGRWNWTDARGARQPRTAQFAYQFSPENPHMRNLVRVYGELEAHFEQQGCMKCHSPANRAKSDVLVLLGYPNQALAARESLVEVLRKNTMPPAEASRRWEKGIRDAAVREQMLRAAEEFRAEGDAALSYEGVKIERPEEWPDRPALDE